MKKKIVILIALIILLLIIITIYKLAYYDPMHKKYYFNPIEIKNEKEDLKNDIVLDSITYKDNIITKDLLSIDYNFFEEKESIKGTIYINNGNLYITDLYNKIDKKVSNKKFKTMYIKDYEYSSGIYVYLITEDYEIYYLSLGNNNINEVSLNKINTNYMVKNFVDLEFKLDKYQSANTVFVLGNDGNIYDISSGIRYNEEIKSMYNKIYVYGDDSIANLYGKMLEDNEGNYYKIKYAFLIYEDNKFSGENTVLIITKDNKLIYISDDNNLAYEFQEKIKNIDFNVKYPYIKSKLIITFEDDSTIELFASCNQYYCNCSLN